MNINSPAGTPFVLPGMKPAAKPDHVSGTRLTRMIPNKVRNLFVALLSEFVGTFLFLFFAFVATQVANTAAHQSASDRAKQSMAPNLGPLLYISLAFGFSLAVNVWVFFRISGGLFNPAVTLGLCLIGAVGWLRGCVVVIAQIVGAITAAGIVSALFPGDLEVRTTLNSGTSVVRGVFIEMFLTAQLVLTIFMLAAEKHKATFLAPIGIGIALFVAELAGVYFTGGSLNPARSFGPDVILRKFDGYHWIYWVGPFLGAFIAVLFFRLIKLLEYETCNPGQDFNDRDQAEQVYNAGDGAIDSRPHLDMRQYSSHSPPFAHMSHQTSHQTSHNEHGWQRSSEMERGDDTSD